MQRAVLDIRRNMTFARRARQVGRILRRAVRWPVTSGTSALLTRVCVLGCLRVVVVQGGVRKAADILESELRIGSEHLTTTDGVVRARRGGGGVVWRAGLSCGPDQVASLVHQMRWHQRKMLDVAAVYLAVVMLVMVACRSAYLAFVAAIRRALRCCGVGAKLGTPQAQAGKGAGDGDASSGVRALNAATHGKAAAVNGSATRGAAGGGADASHGLRRRRLSSADSSSDTSDSSDGRAASESRTGAGGAPAARGRAASAASGGAVSEAAGGDPTLSKVFDDVD